MNAGVLPVDKQGLVEKGQVVSQLQRSRSTDFLAAVEDTVGTSNYGVATGGWSPRKSDAGREVGFVTLDQRVGSSVRAGGDQGPGGVVEIALPVVGFDQRGRSSRNEGQG